jgi:hypothetical protein
VKGADLKMKHSPQKVIELCIYILLIIAAAAWSLATGNTPNPFVTSIDETEITTKN